MNEAGAQEVLLIRAVEGADGEGALLTEEDRGDAGRAAAELVRWQAADQGESATAEAFVARRAAILAARLAERSPMAWRAIRAMYWRPWLGVALPLAALVIGVAAEHITDRRHVNILAFPLLGLMVWNVAVYAWLIVHEAIYLATRSRRPPGWPARLLAGGRRNLGDAAGPLAGTLVSFGADWVQRSGPLVAARVGRVLHLSAVMLALGTIAGLYVRGLAFEYRAGWESTFLGADAVHGILTFFLQPVARLISQPFPGVDEIAALRWGGAGTGENAGRWIYLYTGAVMLSVVAPRLALAAIAWSRERRLAARFPLSLDEPYFRRVLAGWHDSSAQVRVVPYAYTPAAATTEGLQRLADHLLGGGAHVHCTRPVAFGDEDAVSTGAQAPAPDLLIALFNLASTPETENHGVFLDRLKSQARTTVTVIVDEAPYRHRLGAQTATDTRLAERRRAWAGLAATRGLRPVFADLEAPDLAAVERELDSDIAGLATTA